MFAHANRFAALVDIDEIVTENDEFDCYLQKYKKDRVYIYIYDTNILVSNGCDNKQIRCERRSLPHILHRKLDYQCVKIYLCTKYIPHIMDIYMCVFTLTRSIIQYNKYANHRYIYNNFSAKVVKIARKNINWSHSSRYIKESQGDEYNEI